MCIEKYHNRNNAMDSIKRLMELAGIVEYKEKDSDEREENDVDGLEKDDEKDEPEDNKSQNAPEEPKVSNTPETPPPETASASTVDNSADDSHKGRMGRAETSGYNTERIWYHGTTHDFDEFSDENNNKEGHFGAGYYFTTCTADASTNYASKNGPDITNRIERRAEEIMDEFSDYSDEEIDYDEAVAKASEELTGHEGAIIPVYLNLGNTYDIRPQSKTFLAYEYDREGLDWEGYLDDADGDEEYAKDLAFDDEYNSGMIEPKGALVDILTYLDANYGDEYGVSEFLDEVRGDAIDGGMTASELDQMLRNANLEIYDDYGDGGVQTSEAYREAIDAAGFDSILHSGNIFSGMEMSLNTTHAILFDKKRIRSVNAKFQDSESGNLMADGDEDEMLRMKQLAGIDAVRVEEND